MSEKEKHISETMTRRFRANKRREAKLAEKALRELHFGCAFMPRGSAHKISEALRLIQELRKDSREWWRNS